MLIAIDHGNSAVKTPRFQFCSGLTEHLTRPPLAEEIIEYEGRFWTPSNARIAYKRDKTRDNSFFRLLLLHGLWRQGKEKRPTWKPTRCLSLAMPKAL